MRRNGHKFNAVRTTVDGHTFASKAEAKRFAELKMLEKAGEIDGLEIQPEFPLNVRGVKLGVYRGDFAYWTRIDGQRWRILEDVKSPATKTAIYRWKKKHLLAEHGIEIMEVQ